MRYLEVFLGVCIRIWNALNFFFTLGLIPIIVTALKVFGGFNNFLGNGLFFGFGYELLLEFGVEKYVVQDARIKGDYLSMNKEGVFSSVGKVTPKYHRCN